MKIAILSRNPRLYSTRRLVEAGTQRGHEVQVIDTLRAEVEKTSAFNTFNPFTRIVSAHFQNDAGILGAAALASMME